MSSQERLSGQQLTREESKDLAQRMNLAIRQLVADRNKQTIVDPPISVSSVSVDYQAQLHEGDPVIQQASVTPLHQGPESSKQYKASPRPENVVEEPISGFQCPDCSKTSVVNQKKREVARFGDRPEEYEIWENRVLACLGCGWERDLGTETVYSPFTTSNTVVDKDGSWLYKKPEVRDEEIIYTGESNAGSYTNVTDIRTGTRYAPIHSGMRVSIKRVGQFIEYADGSRKTLIPIEHARVDLGRL